ncbi:hypothetical protein H072_640 [Dactylellina haptotyla CBS 200.50]|uniref:Glycosyltransferase family 62 protein n=1 Tax=Dactylellina haptotyla (strain CBS 200.50) TaxID=1284197 RepID=S8CCJ9_DACHA|nr:hypothetical protein H072_640 [Dactylellina haptotyla CBS 200.50]
MPTYERNTSPAPSLMTVLGAASSRTRRSPLRFLATSSVVILLSFSYIFYFTQFSVPYLPAHKGSRQSVSTDLKIHQINHNPSFKRTIIQLPAYGPLTSSPPENLTLLLVLTNDTKSWGHMSAPLNEDWTFSDFIQRIRLQNIPVEKLHLGLLTSDLQSYYQYIDTLSVLLPSETPWAKAEIIYLQSLPSELNSDANEVSRWARHSPKKEFQLMRRRYMARLRNFLSAHMMTPDIQHVVWLDSDVYELPSGMIKRFWELGNISPKTNISRMVKAGLRETKEQNNASDEPSPEKTFEPPLPIGLVTLLSSTRGRRDYDRNAWSGFGKRPSGADLEKVFDGKHFAGMSQWAKSVKQLIKYTGDDDIVRLDSVGGTALYIKAQLLREGVMFTPYQVSGTKWGSDGTDGIETEGMCYIAERIGWGCYALGGSWRTLHSDD